MNSKISVNPDAGLGGRGYRKVGLSLALLAGLLSTACQTVQTTQPGSVGITRTQSMGVSSEEINTASAVAYSKMLRKRRAKIP